MIIAVEEVYCVWSSEVNEQDNIRGILYLYVYVAHMVGDSSESEYMVVLE